MDEEKNKNSQEEKKEEKNKQESSDEKNTGMAALAYVFFLIPFLTGYKDDEFVMYHVKQGAVLFFTGLILTAIPLIGWLLNIGILILFFIGVSNAFNGEKKELPLIGKFGKKINF